MFIRNRERERFLSVTTLNLELAAYYNIMKKVFIGKLKAIICFYCSNIRIFREFVHPSHARNT